MEGGTDTTGSVILAFVHAMTKWPDLQRRAQEQIDSVIGEDRSPTWADYDKLPYVATCVKETMRWRSVAPLGVPHSLTQEDWVDGLLLPKDSDILINVFGMHDDEQRFPNPDVFDPDHYKGYTALASELAHGAWEHRDHYTYGSARRMCPGYDLAERAVFVAFAKILWALRIERGRDASGNIIEPDVSCERAYSEGLLVSAEPYPCSISPHPAKRTATILRELSSAEVEVFPSFESPTD